MFEDLFTHWDWTVFAEVVILTYAFFDIRSRQKRDTGWFQEVATIEDLPLVILLGLVGLAMPTALQAGGLLVYVGWCYVREMWRNGMRFWPFVFGVVMAAIIGGLAMTGQ